MSKTELIQKKKSVNPITEEELLIHAKATRLELEDKLPEEYNNLVSEAYKATRTFAKDYVPKFQEALFKAGLKGLQAREIIIADCQKIGWNFNTIRKYLDSSLKKQSMVKGGKNAAKKRVENKQQEKRTTPEGIELENVEQEQESILYATPKISKQITEKIKFSMENGGKGAITITYNNKNEITNVAAVIPTDKQKEKEKVKVEQ